MGEVAAGDDNRDCGENQHQADCLALSQCLAEDSDAEYKPP